jgi:PAS domain S-box-containing protein
MTLSTAAVIESFAATAALLSDVGVMIELSQRRVVHVNPRFSQTLGHGAADIVGRTPTEAGWVKDGAAFDAFLEKVAGRGDTVAEVHQVLHQDGSTLDWSLRAAFIRAGRQRFVQLIARDVAGIEQLRLEREAVFHGVPLGIALTRAQRFVHVNAPFERILGWAPGTLAGQPGRAIWPSDEVYQAFGRRVGPDLVRGLTVEVELPEMMARDGSRPHLRVLAKVLDPSRPQEGGTVWIVEDITERMRMRQALQDAVLQAESASRAKSAFLANMSHELRTPLNAVLGLARLMQQGPADAERQREYLDLIADNAAGLTRIVSDILDLSKIDAGKMTLEAAVFDLHELVRTLHASYSVLAKTRGLRFGVTIEAGVPRVVLADPVRLRQILGNFVSNALKFTSAGVVHIRVTMAAGGQVRLAVQDTGCGFDDETCARLFQPFSQADNSTTRRHGGTGLGLSICRELAALMGGSVGAQSQVGQGSEFWAELPLPASEVEPQASNFGDLDETSLSGLHVLVVEDNPVNLLICRAMLKQRGMLVVDAANGALAVEAVAQAAAAGRPFDAVVMDVQMPVMDGLEATARLREHWSRKELPIIGLSAAAMTSDRDAALQAGMNEFTTKPIEPRRLAAALVRAMARRHA